MANNYLITIPQIADKFRTLGYSKPEPIQLKPLSVDSLNPANNNYYDQWRKEAIQTVYDGLNSVRSSQMNYLLEKPYPKKTNNTAQAIFTTASNWNNKWNNEYSGGNMMTPSSRLSEDDFNKYRVALLNRRIKDLGGETPQMPVQMPPDQYLNYNIAKIDNNLILTSIEERVLSNIVDYGTYNDLVKVVRFYNTYIWEIDDNQSIVDLVNRLENLETEVEGLKPKRTDLSKRQRKDVQYIEAFLDTLNRLIAFVQDYSSVVGQNVSVRQAKAKASSKILTSKGIQPQNLEEPSPQPAPQSVEQPMQQPDEEEELAPIFRDTFRLDPNISSLRSQEQLRSLARVRDIPIYNVDSAKTIRKLLYGQPLDRNEKARRQRDPTLYTGSGKRNYNKRY